MTAKMDKDLILTLSENESRNKSYNAFIAACRLGKATVEDIIRLGYKLMKKEKLFHHYFKDQSLLSTAEYLAYYALKKPLKKWDDKLTQEEAINIIRLFELRIAKRLPVAYITQETLFCGYQFYVNEHVLVPRSIMASRFKDFLNNTHWENYRVLDLCTGSGCIGITLALLMPMLQVDLLDISADALAVAQININKHALNDRVKCIQSNLFEYVDSKYDLIISNPPYVSSEEYKNCAEEFKKEPKIALEAGEDGLDIINRIIAQAKDYLNPNGTLIIEVGPTAVNHIKKQHPHITFKWLKHLKANGKEPLFSQASILQCNRSDLMD